MLAFGLGLGSLAFEAMAAGFGGIGALRTGRPELMVAVSVVFALLGVTTALTGGVRRAGRGR